MVFFILKTRSYFLHFIFILFTFWPNSLLQLESTFKIKSDFYAPRMELDFCPVCLCVSVAKNYNLDHNF